MKHDLWANRVVTTAVVAVAELPDTGSWLCATYVFNSGRGGEVRTVEVQP